MRPKFIQIAIAAHDTGGDEIFALDEDGDVWRATLSGRGWSAMTTIRNPSLEAVTIADEPLVPVSE